jgi:hypothetical protein
MKGMSKMTYKQQENLTGAEPSVDEEPIGTYGMKWIEWIKANHPHLVNRMKLKHTFLTVARSVDKAAWEYRELLDKQYAKANPRPSGFERIVEWEETRAFYTDGQVMRERGADTRNRTLNNALFRKNKRRLNKPTFFFQYSKKELKIFRFAEQPKNNLLVFPKIKIPFSEKTALDIFADCHTVCAQSGAERNGLFCQST